MEIIVDFIKRLIMNCFLRIDDDFEYFDWNQNLLFFVFDFIICEDFNGIVNVCEQCNGVLGGVVSVFGVLNDEKGSFIKNCDK